MATVTILENAAHAATLRAELKEWEREFAAANGGKKAGRGDIKSVPDIAAKYKEYSRLRAHETSSLSNKPEKARSRNTDSDERSHKRKHSSPNGPGLDHTQPTTTSTPRKSSRGGIFQTPSKTRDNTGAHPSNVDPYDSPSVLRRLFSPSTHMKTPSPLKPAIGPTPQRDGKALGLFDLLSESGGSTATPSATRIASVKGMAAQTPSMKNRRKTMDTIAEEDEEEENIGRGERTPASSGKKYMLSALFATPTTLRYSAMVEGEGSKGLRGKFPGGDPSPQPMKNEDTMNPSLDTPLFLRRSTSGLHNSSSMGGTGTGLSPIPVRKPVQFVGKGLSQLVQGLRDMEEEQMDDDMDMLREMEAEQQEGFDRNVDVPDSQMPNNETTGRTYKKKGQKRTTRLVRMKPVVSAKPQKARFQSESQQTKGNTGTDNEADESADEPLAIAEIQAHAPISTANNDPFDNTDDLNSLHSISDAGSQSEYESEPELDSDSDPEYGGASKPSKPSKPKSFSEKMKEAIGSAKTHTPAPTRDDNRKKPEKVKEAQAQEEKENKKLSGRKVNPNAHANYRSLKIRNRGSKAGGRNFGRFRRR
ncbi:DNA replication/checkpoint protein [Aspergillus californicus]